jgi:hypothetical protein
MISFPPPAMASRALMHSVDPSQLENALLNLEGAAVLRKHHRHEKLPDNLLVRCAKHVGDTLVAIEHRPVFAEGEGPFLHLLDQDAIWLISAFERVDPMFLDRSAHNQCADFASADSADRLLTVPELAMQLLDERDQGARSALSRSFFIGSRAVGRRDRRDVQSQENTLGLRKVADNAPHRQW